MLRQRVGGIFPSRELCVAIQLSHLCSKLTPPAAELGCRQGLQSGCREGVPIGKPGEISSKDEERLDRGARLLGKPVSFVLPVGALRGRRHLEAASVHRAEVGFVERGAREVGIALAWRFADGLSLSMSELLVDLD